MDAAVDQSERNREIVRRIFASLEEGSFDDVQGILDERLRAPAKRSATESKNVFPDLRVSLEDLIAEGDKVVVRWTARGTHKGEARERRLGRVRPTGRRLEVSGITIVQLRDGQIVDTWGLTDEMTGAEQLGLLREAPDRDNGPRGPRPGTAS